MTLKAFIVYMTFIGIVLTITGLWYCLLYLIFFGVLLGIPALGDELDSWHIGPTP